MRKILPMPKTEPKKLDAKKPARLNYLRQWRELRGLTQDSLAAIVGTKGSVISLFENGKRGLDDVWLRRLAKPLRTSPGAILEINPEQADPALLSLLEVWGMIPDDRKSLAITVLGNFATKQEPSPPRKTGTRG